MKSEVRYSVRIKRSAARELKRLPTAERSRVVGAIDTLADNPFAGSSLKGTLRGIRRLRSGSYRILYELQESTLVVLVVRIAHRREAYRRPIG